MENSPLAQEARRRWDELRQERIQFEDDWTDIARLMRPQRGGFGMDTATQRQLTKALGSEPMIAHGNFAAGIYSGITNPATRWAGFTTPDEDLNRWPPFAEWLDRQTAKVYASLSPSSSSFYTSCFQAYADIAAFGNAAGYDEVDTGNRKFVDVTLSLAGVVVDVDHHGRVVEVVRKYRLTARQAVRAFGDLPKKLMDQAEKGDTERHVFYHHVRLNDQFVPRALGPRGKQYLSVYACETGECVVRIKGYDEMPFYYPRWDVDSEMTYGIGPGYIALASARTHDLMENATLRAAQRAADPVKMAPDRNVIPLNGTFRPGSVVYGAVSMSGQPLIRSEDFNGNIGLTEEEKRQKVETVKEAFYYSIMSLTGRTGVSNEENRVIEEARLRNWAPHADRIMEEWAARKFERRYRLLFKNGQIDPPPPGTPDGVPLQTRYQSQAEMALRASEAQAVRTFLNDLAPLMQLKPEVRHRFSADDYVEVLHEASPSLPQRLLVSREQAAAAAQQEQQAAQAAQAAQMAREGGAGMRDMAQAAQIMGAGGDER
ncbi:portal protein [Mameliella alba]|uniref:Phage head-tail connector protein n=1 Tax=Mameliella alba TaxID=561184 RepID=A0A0B3RQX1_9RHOB|nr:portal protein [Mameliella alba]KHQ50287.1 Phage head-tail connector protein [Mameliella alba]